MLYLIILNYLPLMPKGSIMVIVRHFLAEDTMLIFLDTEFTDPLNCDLISIGMVGENGGCELYLERSDFEESWCNPFVRSAVLPQLGLAGPQLTRRQVAERLASWFSTLQPSVMIACDCYTDWELLLDALGDHCPANLLGRFDLHASINTTIFNRAVVQYHEQYGPWHHALHDARAHRYGWLAWKAQQSLLKR
jgi:hypothetical protein